MRLAPRPLVALVLLSGVLAASLAPVALAKEPPGNVALVDAYMGAWNAHDAGKAAAFFAENGTYFDASVGTPQVGRANAQKNVIEAFLKAVPDCKWVRDGEPIVDAKGIAFQWTFTGTNTGDWADGTKATGKPFTLKGVSFVRVENGKIVYQGDFYDALGFYKQLGMM
jgi:steroid delta-isomerase-like uncharacterized protein